jgi:hypothetical protein
MKYVILIAIPLILGTLGGFAGGLVVTHNAEALSAKEFILLDQTGRPRGMERRARSAAARTPRATR